MLEIPLTLGTHQARLLGHWGTTPGLNLLYVHLNRLIKDNDLNMIYVIGPGHGGPGLVAQTYLEGSYTEHYPAIERSRHGMRRLFRQFSWPTACPATWRPRRPGSIHEGGELGYSLAHAYGAAFDNPGLIVAVRVGDGEAETGALAASWHSNKFLNPARDGAVLPILHLNGYKIANPTVLARISRQELTDLLRGYGYEPQFVEGDDPALVHQAWRRRWTRCWRRSARSRATRAHPATQTPTRPRWPMIVLRTPKGWTGPKFVDGMPVEGTWRAHQVPIAEFQEPRAPAPARRLVEELPAGGAVRRARQVPRRIRRARAHRPAAHGVESARQWRCAAAAAGDAALRDHAVAVAAPGSVEGEATRVLGALPARRDEAQPRVGQLPPLRPGRDRVEPARRGVRGVGQGLDGRVARPLDTDLSPDGRVMEVLSEHLCEGWLEGYLLTGRHGLFSCYEAFIHIVDSMFNQHAKWLKVSAQHSVAQAHRVAELPAHLACLAAGPQRLLAPGSRLHRPSWPTRRPMSCASTCRPTRTACSRWPTTACAAATTSTSSSPASSRRWQWLDMDAAVRHCAAGAGIWDWASNERRDPDVVMACAGDVPTLEALAAVTLLRELCARHPHPRRQRRRPDGAAAAVGASARPGRPRVRCAVHHRQAGDLRLPRLPRDRFTS